MQQTPQNEWGYFDNLGNNKRDSAEIISFHHIPFDENVGAIYVY